MSTAATSQGPPVIAVLGLGEAGSRIAADLAAAGARVRGFDPLVPAGAGVTGCADDADACRGAAVVLSLTSAHESERALRAALTGIGGTGGTGHRGHRGHRGARHLRRPEYCVAGAEGAPRRAGCRRQDRFRRRRADVAGTRQRAPHADAGIRPPAARFAAAFRALGATVDVLPGPRGDAATRKLVRSVFYKGLAASVTEALRAARAAGCEDWLRANIASELAGASEATVDRLERGSVRHARRRAEEMAAAAELLTRLGVPARIASASEQWLRDLMAGTGSA